MVDVADRPQTPREAVAEGFIRMEPAVLALVLEGRAAKGDVLAVARVAAIQAAKRTGDLIPLCHPLPLDGVDVRFEVHDAGVRVEATARCTGRTGVEMEALTACSVAGLTVIDMLKAIDRTLQIDGVRLLAKSGGTRGDWRAE